jgi:hypothetical protein
VSVRFYYMTECVSAMYRFSYIDLLNMWVFPCLISNLYAVYVCWLSLIRLCWLWLWLSYNVCCHFFPTVWIK